LLDVVIAFLIELWILLDLKLIDSSCHFREELSWKEYIVIGAKSSLKSIHHVWV